MSAKRFAHAALQAIAFHGFAHLRDTVKPKREGVPPMSERRQNAAKKRLVTRNRHRRPAETRRTAKPALLWGETFNGKGLNEPPRLAGEKQQCYLAARTASSSLTVSLCRPLARRRASTARPSAVFMRTRNPWVLARFRLLG